MKSSLDYAQTSGISVNELAKLLYGVSLRYQIFAMHALTLLYKC